VQPETERLAQLLIYLAAVVAWSIAGPKRDGLAEFHKVRTLGEKKWRELAGEKRECA
jgi:hypothetical protein